MHFRHLLITSLMVGAAMFLPGQAFAEKNELSGQQNSQRASVKAVPSAQAANHANVPVQAVDAKSQKKTVVVPKPAVTNKGIVKQQASNNTTLRKVVTTPPKLPDQAKGNVQAAIKRTEKVVKPSRAEIVNNNRELEKNKPTFKRNIGNSLDNSDPKVKNTQSKKLIHKIEPKEEDTRLSKAKGKNGFKPFVPAQQKKGKVPASKEEIPDLNQMMSQTERTNSGGKSNDRVSQGTNTISPIDKWFEWTQIVGLKPVQPYLSRQAWMNNQWVNAPPSPPPQEAPLLKTVTRS